jgi:hypothetical protein
VTDQKNKIGHAIFCICLLSKKLLGGINVVHKKCPNCGKEYSTKLERKRPDLVVQKEFPTAKPHQREQLISGICSDECWDEFCGGVM